MIIRWSYSTYLCFTASNMSIHTCSISSICLSPYSPTSSTLMALSAPSRGNCGSYLHASTKGAYPLALTGNRCNTCATSYNIFHYVAYSANLCSLCSIV